MEKELPKNMLNQYELLRPPHWFNLPSNDGVPEDIGGDEIPKGMGVVILIL